MPIVVPEIDAVIPDGIVDLESYRAWARSDEFPEVGRFSYLNGKVWMDLTMEQVYIHARLKTIIAMVLCQIVETEDLGQFFTDGVSLSHLQANFTTEPDAIFVSFASLENGTVRGCGGTRGGCTEFIGAPDMVLEVVSPSSARKDAVEMMDLYFRAGVPEYWLVDARRDGLRFDVYRPGSDGYQAAPRDADGWIMSEVFGRAFRLTRGIDRAGDPKFTLEVRKNS